jgi:hypothetical protein
MNLGIFGIEILLVLSGVSVVQAYGSISPPLSFPPAYQDPQDPNNMTKTCQNLAEQDAQGRGILPNDILACFDYLPNATLINMDLTPQTRRYQ